MVFVRGEPRLRPAKDYPGTVVRRGHPGDDEDTKRQEEEFEEVVAALLQVDPAGIAGKHRKEEPESEPNDP